MSLPLDEIAVLVEVVERGSLVAAASALGLAPPIVTKRLKSLEERLEVQLVVRTTRRLALTDAGRLLYEQVRDVPRTIADAEERVRDQQRGASGRLRVIMPTYFASSGFHHQVIPAYLAAHPEVQLELEIVGDPVGMLGSDFDLLVAARWPHQRFPDTTLVHRRIHEHRGALFCTPAYLEAHGTPRHPRDLTRHNCLSYPDREWHFTDHDGASIVVRTQGTLTTSSNAMLYAATMSSLGVAFTFPYFFDVEVADGRVVTVLDEFTRGSWLDVHIFYPAARFLPRRTRAFIDALAAHFDQARSAHVAAQAGPGAEREERATLRGSARRSPP